MKETHGSWFYPSTMGGYSHKLPSVRKQMLPDTESGYRDFTSQPLALRNSSRAGMVVSTSHLSAWEVEAEGSQVHGQPKLHKI